jgi:enoyl-CoA hydratase
LRFAAVKHVSLADIDGVMVLAIDRAPANALDIDLLESINAAVEHLGAHTPPAVVLAGCDGFFSAGADLKAMPSYGPAEQRRMIHGINTMVLGVYGLGCPVVAAVTGHAIAGGLVLALCADLRVASNKGRYGLTEIKVGIGYPQAAIGVVRAELPSHAARLLALGGRLIDAEECLRLSALDELVAPDAVLPRAIERARDLAAYPADTYERIKHDLRGEPLAALRAAAADDPLLPREPG